MSSPDDQQRMIKPAQLCGTHRYLLIHQTGFNKQDPWMALEIATQIALFQACTVDDRIWKKLDGNLDRFHEVGCMACAKPDAFGEIVQVACDGDVKADVIGAIKKLGEQWLADARAAASRKPS